MKQIYGIRDIISKKIVLDYRTYQGNVKKCFFSTEKDALEVLDTYIKKGYRSKDWHEQLEVFVIGQRLDFEEGKSNEPS